MTTETEKFLRTKGELIIISVVKPLDSEGQVSLGSGTEQDWWTDDTAPLQPDGLALKLLSRE